jgi:hypothetical protein
MHNGNIYKYELKDYHYNGISKLQEYYGKKIATSNDNYIIRWAEQCLDYLTEIKEGQFYTTKQKLFLNNCREEYLLSKKSTPFDLIVKPSI